MAFVIGIAGGTASGKTTVARRLVEAVHASKVAFLEQDAYYKDLSDLPMEERQQFNFDHPDAFDVDKMVAQLRELREGRAVERPVYDFSKHTPAAETVRVEPAPVVVIEGILVLAIEPLRRLLDIKIFVDTDDDVRVLRRIERDVRDRGRSLQSVIEQYFRTVRPMHLGFVEPSKRFADIVIPHGGGNEVAIEMVASAIRARL
ncbi:MAG: uridine kinase [Myxococcales bacterium]